MLAVYIAGLSILYKGCNYVPEQVGLIESVAGNPALEYWREQYPDNDIIKWDKGDITDNGRKDTVIIFSVGWRKNSMVVVLDYPEGYEMTEETPAPVENQTIEFKKIDDKPPNELIITGSKGPYVGYAIYRMEGGELVDLFSQDMDLCC